MWEQVARSAVEDAHCKRDPLPLVDDLGVVHCQSWAYDDPAGRLADRLGLGPGRRATSILAGTSPQRLIDGAAEEMLAGRTRVALVVGAEALHTRKVLTRAGEGPRWSHPHPDPPALPVDLDQWYLPTEIRHGILPAWLTFALLEQARWAARGATGADRAALYQQLADLNRVAVDNPDAWFRDPRDAVRLGTPSAGNRMVTTPYTKLTTAFMDVDMAAGHLLMTHEAADDLGVPADRRVYLRGWGFARDAVHVGARDDLTSSPAMRRATSGALGMAGLSVDDVDVFDLYSCFGSAVAFARDALDLADDDPRDLTVTGGLAAHGGPSSNYMGHSISHLTDRLRAGGDGTVGMVTGIGMHMTKHVAAVWSTRPGPLGPPPAPVEQSWAGRGQDLVPVVDSYEGPARVVAATVVHEPDGAPDRAVTVCELPDRSRCYAASSDADVVARVGADDWVFDAVQIGPGPGGTNDVRW
jgi:acetyl-CoA C-acetyltransferase